MVEGKESTTVTAPVGIAQPTFDPALYIVNTKLAVCPTAIVPGVIANPVWAGSQGVACANPATETDVNNKLNNSLFILIEFGFS